jgi:hypothetical protein
MRCSPLRIAIVIVAVAAALASGCGSSLDGGPPVVHVAALSCTADAQCGARQLCVDRQCFELSGATQLACADMPIHFADGTASLDRVARAEVDQAAVCVRSHHDVRVSIAAPPSDDADTLATARAQAIAEQLHAGGVAPPDVERVTPTP